jgi:RNA polymerase sigma-70 factor (ECF subfamily)
MNVGKVYAFCLRLTVDTTLAEKLTTEVFLTCWRNISLFREDTLFSSWLTGITTYTILEWIRNNGGFGNNPDQSKLQNIKSSLRKKNADFFEAEIQSLPHQERFVFVLHDIEKYTIDEIADLLSLTKENVNEHLQKAYKLLKPPGGISDERAFIEKSLDSLPQVIQPGNDIWKYIFSALNKEKVSVNKNSNEYLKEPEAKIQAENKKKKFGFLSRKKE